MKENKHSLTATFISGELKLDSSSDCRRFRTGLIFSQQHRPSSTDITNQTGFKKAVQKQQKQEQKQGVRLVEYHNDAC